MMSTEADSQPEIVALTENLLSHGPFPRGRGGGRDERREPSNHEQRRSEGSNIERQHRTSNVE